MNTLASTSSVARTRLALEYGPEVGATGTVALAREVHAWEVLVERDRDERVGLVVAQADVEARPVLLDEALLGQQRLGLAGDDDAFDVLHRRDHLGVARAARHLRLGEVRRDALAHRLGLADVDHAPLAVAEQVHARLVGQLRRCSARLVRASPSPFSVSVAISIEDTGRPRRPRDRRAAGVRSTRAGRRPRAGTRQ